MIVESVLEHVPASQFPKRPELFQIPGQGRLDAAARFSPGFHHLGGQVLPFRQEMEEISLPQVPGKSQFLGSSQYRFPGPGQVLFPFRMGLGLFQVPDHRIPAQVPEDRQGGKNAKIRCLQCLCHGCSPSVSGSVSRLSLTVWGPRPRAIWPVVAISRIS